MVHMYMVRATSGAAAARRGGAAREARAGDRRDRAADARRGGSYVCVGERPELMCVCVWVLNPARSRCVRNRLTVASDGRRGRRRGAGGRWGGARKGSAPANSRPPRFFWRGSQHGGERATIRLCPPHAHLHARQRAQQGHALHRPPPARQGQQGDGQAHPAQAEGAHAEHARPNARQADSHANAAAPGPQPAGGPGGGDGEHDGPAQVVERGGGRAAGFFSVLLVRCTRGGGGAARGGVHGRTAAARAHAHDDA